MDILISNTNVRLFTFKSLMLKGYPSWESDTLILCLGEVRMLSSTTDNYSQGRSQPSNSSGFQVKKGHPSEIKGGSDLSF